MFLFANTALNFGCQSPSKTKISKSGNLGYVDVRDVALTHILAYEKPEASGRYLCYAASKYQSKVVAALRAAVPDATLPTEEEEGEQSTAPAESAPQPEQEEEEEAYVSKKKRKQQKKKGEEP